MARTRSGDQSRWDNPPSSWHAGVEAEAVRQVGGDVELAAADVDVAVRRLAERDDAGVERFTSGRAKENRARLLF